MRVKSETKAIITLYLK